MFLWVLWLSEICSRMGMQILLQCWTGNQPINSQYGWPLTHWPKSADWWVWQMTLTTIDKNHTRIAYRHVCCLSSVLILQEKWSIPIDHPRDQEWMLKPYHDRPLFHLTFHHDIIHQVQRYSHQWRPIPSTMLGHIIPQGPHHQQELFQEVSSGISAEIHRRPVKIWASRLAFSPD